MLRSGGRDFKGGFKIQDELKAGKILGRVVLDFESALENAHT